MELSPYLYFNGQCEEAFRFYERCLGGKDLRIMRYGGSPAEAQMPAEMRDQVMHARMAVGDRLLMGSDAPPNHYHQPQGFSVCVTVDTPEEAERIWSQLAESGNIFMPLGETFWARSFGMLTDRFGIAWIVDCEKGG